MDEFDDIAGIPNALRERIKRRKTAEAWWKNRSDKRILASVLSRSDARGFAKWRKDHPEGLLANAAKARDALAQSRKDPEEARYARAVMEERLWPGAAKWREENPEAATAKLEKGRKASAQGYAQRYSKRLQAIKAAIPTAGVSIYELQKLFPQWNFDKLRHLLRKAVQRGDLALTQVLQKHCSAPGAVSVNWYTVPEDGPPEVQA